MRSVRKQVLQRFLLEGARVREPDDELKNALYALLWSIQDEDLSIDGWAYFRVIRESKESLDAVGLMTLLPAGSVPIEINIKGLEGGFAWSVQIGRLDPAWLALSDSKRWKFVYLYANGDREVPPWTWVDSTMAQCMKRQRGHKKDFEGVVSAILIQGEHQTRKID